MLKRRDRLGCYAICMAATTLLVVQIAACFYGLDLTDEGMYLNWLVKPDKYSGSVTQFGFVYSPVFHFLGQNVAYIRIFNVLTTFALTWILFWQIRGPWPRAMSVAIAFAGAASSLALFDMHLITPNYNSLNFQSLILFAIGVLSFNSIHSYTRRFSDLLIGVGGAMTFLAKPTTSLALAAWFVLWFSISQRSQLKRLVTIICCATSFVLLSAYSIDGSLSGFIARYSLGLQMLAVQGAGHTLSTFQTMADPRLLSTLACGVAFSCLLLTAVERSIKLLIVGLCLLALSITFGQLFPSLLELNRYTLFTLLCAIIVASWSGKKLPFSNWSAAVFLSAFLPFAYANGSANNTWFLAPNVSAFWFLSAVVLVTHRRSLERPQGLILLISTAAILSTGIRLNSGWQTPYRQTPGIWQFHDVINDNLRVQSLRLSPLIAEHIRNSRRVLRDADFPDASLLIDLSGQSPGLVFTSDAVSPGQAWMIGGYPGSEKRLSLALRTVSCEELATAWLLEHDEAQFGFDKSVLQKVGLAPESYLPVGSWPGIDYSGGTKRGRLTLLKPTESSAGRIGRCKELRHELDKTNN